MNVAVVLGIIMKRMTTMLKVLTALLLLISVEAFGHGSSHPTKCDREPYHKKCNQVYIPPKADIVHCWSSGATWRCAKNQVIIYQTNNPTGSVVAVKAEGVYYMCEYPRTYCVQR